MKLMHKSMKKIFKSRPPVIAVMGHELTMEKHMITRQKFRSTNGR